MDDNHILQNTDEELLEEVEELTEDHLSDEEDDEGRDSLNSIENVIEWLNRDREAGFTVSQRKYINLIEKLDKKYPDAHIIKVRNKDGSIFAKFPLNWVHIYPPTTRELTPEQREKLIQQLQKGRETHAKKQQQQSE